MSTLPTGKYKNVTAAGSIIERIFLNLCFFLIEKDLKSKRIVACRYGKMAMG
jgi:hypothetical protein